MRRRYRRELYAERIAYIRKLMPHAGIGVDVITGFPGETDEDFLETYNFLKESEVSYLHVFTYSERDNTDALQIRPVVPIPIRKQRNKMLRILSDKLQHSFSEKYIGKSFDVLFENSSDDGWIRGFTGNYIKVKTQFEGSLANKLLRCTLGSPDELMCLTAEVEFSVSN